MDNYELEEDLKKRLGEKKFKLFIEWMFGQAYPIIDGKNAYYKGDIERFENGTITKKERK